MWLACIFFTQTKLHEHDIKAPMFAGCGIRKRNKNAGP